MTGLRTITSALGLSLLTVMNSPAQSLPTPERGFVSSKPASNWEEGLICGNGTIGMLAFSRPLDERIIFSHEELFMPMGAPTVPPDQSEHLPEIRQLIADGKYKEAEALQAKHSGQDGFMYPDFFVPAFDMTLATTAEGEVKDYARSVDFSTGEARIKWSDDRGAFERRMFCSRDAGVAVIELLGPKPGSLDYKLRLEQRQLSKEFNKDTDIAQRSDEVFKEHIGNIQNSATENSLSFSNDFKKSYERSIKSLNGQSRVVVTGGTTKTEDDGTLVIEGADRILILTDIRLLKEKDSSKFIVLKSSLENLSTDYSALLSLHTTIHGGLFNRVKLDLGGGDDHKKTTEELMELSTWEDINMALLEKQFDAGRYNIISSTGKLPPTLQGIWGATYVPNWASDFTHNGNVPSAIAANLPGNMPELTLAYTNYIESLIPDLELNAKHLFGARGVVLPSRTSTHGYNNAYSKNFAGGMWVAGAGKAARFFYDYYLFTGDIKFLANHTVPYLEKCALFFEDYLYEDENGQFIFSPCQSPENWPAGSKSQATFNSTMDIAVAKEVLTNLIHASRTLGVNADKIPVWEGMLKKMPPYMLNDEGIIKEWLTPVLGNNDKHRHSSQLYPLYYVLPEEIEKDKKLQDGFRKSVEFKLAEHWKDKEDRGFMSFGLVQLGQVVSTLGDGELAHLCLRHLVNRFWLNNLASMHNHRHLFNMDISGGQPALIIQMLVGSDLGKVRLLPALPKEWKKGTLEGALCRGAIELNRLHWDGKKIEVEMTSKTAQEIELSVPSNIKTITGTGADIKESKSATTRMISLPGNKKVSISITLK